MTIDLFHNKIIKDNMSDAFKLAVYSELLPLLADKYGTTLLGVQMYEDCLDLNFTMNGEFYYPLTLVFDDGVKREWIKWSVAGKRRFADGIPFAFIGEDSIGFSIVESAPDGFAERLNGHSSYFEGGYAPLKIDAPTSSRTLLVGKYSQSFIDEMNRQISREIERMFSVSGIADSGVELLVVFAPGTYMEHRQDNVTYRRLLISARACAARDLWIKWTRLDGGAPYTVADNVSAADIKFELGEDVSQKIREKEYRFLVASSPEKYQSAMGRRNITEWRDMIKRVIKRGELKKLDAVKDDHERAGELTYKLQEVLTGYTAPTTDNSDINELLRSVISPTREEKAPEYAKAETVPEASAAPVKAEPVAEELVQETINIDEAISTETKREVEAPEAPAVDEAALRRQIEAEVRAQIALEAKKKAEEEAEALRLAHERLKEENERLEDRAREAEDKLAAEAERIAENERLRAELEALQRAEAREKERMAEAARLALIDQKRYEAERAEEERAREREAEAAREAARIAEAEALRIAAERAEAERAEREEAERRMAEQRAAEEQRRVEIMRIEAEQKAAAEAERQRAEEAEREAKAAAERAQQSYTYVSKNVRILFKRPVDPNITKRIHEIILSAIKYFHKENVFMKIKASVPDATTVNLHFVKFPEEEHDFLVNIIKVLGKSELGITKVFLE